MLDCTIITICGKPRDVYPHPKNYEVMAPRLVSSIRKNGGKCSNIPICIWYSEDKKPDKKTFDLLEEYGCSFQKANCLYPSKPVFNKISAMQTSVCTRYSMFMDTDTYVLSDFSELILNNPVDVAASDNHYVYHKWARPEEDYIWEKYYNMFGIEYPGPRMTTCLDGKEGNFYFNSAVVLFRNDIGFQDLYFDTATNILNSGIEENEMNFTQTSLSLAVLRGKYSYKVIPQKYHQYWSLHRKILEDTCILHYQDAFLQCEQSINDFLHRKL